VHLVRDLLDERVIDRNGRELGRVDSIIFEMRDDGPPLVSAIEIGFITAMQRVHPALGRWARAFERWCGIAAERPVRIPFSKILDFEPKVRVDLTSSEVGALAFEQKARAIIAAIPGGK
jgi:sporulation protein YlmC with PRC-barrel domain